MAEQQTLDEDTILRMIQALPRDQQVRLAHRILDTGLATINPETGRPYIASSALRGIGLGVRPAPSDEDIERWRMEKYTE
jgi:hypothetical protein